MKKVSDLKVIRQGELNVLEQAALLAAIQVQPKAYAPYSNYKVGVAVVSRSNRIFTGVNVENVHYKVPHADTVASQIKK